MSRCRRNATKLKTRLKKTGLGVVAAHALLSLLAAPLAAQLPPTANEVYVVGDVEVNLAAEHGVIIVEITPNPAKIAKTRVPLEFPRVLLPCPLVKFPGCADLVEGDRVAFLGHFATLIPSCEEPVTVRNPLVADDIQLCNPDCHSLAVEEEP